MICFGDYLGSVVSALEKVQVSDSKGDALAVDEGFSRWCRITVELKEANATMYFIGNGASAMMASHMAADASKNGAFCSLAFNDTALLTAVSNDTSYEYCFTFPLKRFAKPGDVLVTISSSGNSLNIVRAIQCAKELALSVVTLSGMSQDNLSRGLGDLNFYVPADTYGIVEASHQVILHCWLDMFVEEHN